MDHRSLRAQAVAQHDERVRDRRGELPSDEMADVARVKRAFSEHDTQLHGGKKTKLTGLRDGGCAEGGVSARRLDRPGRKRGGRADGGIPDPVPMPMNENKNDRSVPMPMIKGQDTGDKMDAETISHGTMKRARGGKAPKKAHTNVNVIVASGKGDSPTPVPVPVPAAGPPPRPPMPPPGAGGPPPGMGGPPMGGPGMPPPGAGMPPGMPPRPMPPGMPMRALGGGVSEAEGKNLAFKMKAGAASGLGRIAKSKMKIPDEAAAGD